MIRKRLEDGVLRETIRAEFLADPALTPEEKIAALAETFSEADAQWQALNTSIAEALRISDDTWAAIRRDPEALAKALNETRRTVEGAYRLIDETKQILPAVPATPAPLAAAAGGSR